ncbi:MAG TPA: methyl-accepting chemotaxis protein [Oscillospiraceae bacterium]|nr:methyl-accepting chemotaxis protein [Oscillospiraceae bacterium]
MKKTKSIKKTLLLCMIGLAVGISILVGTVSGIILYQNSYEGMQDEADIASKAYSQSLQNKIQQYIFGIEQASVNDTITDSNLSAVTVQAMKDKLASQYGFLSIDTADESGKTDVPGINISDREYFKQALIGKTYISSPVISKKDSKSVIFIAKRVNNLTGIGVVFAAISSDAFSSMVDNATVGKTGYSFVVDKTGTIVANKDRTSVNNSTNYIEKAKKDASLNGIAAITKSMIAGKTGSQEYSLNGNQMYISYRPIAGTDGWSIGVTAKVSEMMSKFYNAILIMIILMILFIAISFLVAFKIAKPIAQPIVRMVQRFEKLAQGDLHTEVPVISSENEIGVLSNSFATTVTTLDSYVSEISTVLTSLAEGDCTVETHQEYLGDFVAIKTSLNTIITNLNDMFTEINQSADQVSSGSDQVSSASQALAQGATEQASSIEELSASVTEVSEKVNKNATNAANANKISLEASAEVQRGNEHMQQMNAAMLDISEKSSEIGKIIKTIEDIAFQTNILALNAAVEAARAGEAGKGFSVVADEVRNLASKSAEAAKNTTALIESTMQAVANGSKIADETAASLNAIIEGAKKTTDLISEIAAASNEQANSINQITLGVDQISAVVRTNSATSEESAATSEELSSQAKALQETLSFFKLKNQPNTAKSEFEPEFESEFEPDEASLVSTADKY